VADFVAANPAAEIGGTPVADWVLWDTGLTAAAYGARMRTGNHWGGAIEMAVAGELMGCSIHVYEAARGGGGGGGGGGGRLFKRISAFGEESESGAIAVVYSGRVHYDALELRA
jgi:hypothetical protein